MNNKNKVFILLGTTIIIFIMIVFFKDLKWNSYKILNIGLYSADCGKYGNCLKFDSMEELRKIHSKVSGANTYNLWLNPWEDVQNFDSLHTYYESLKNINRKKKNLYMYSMILNRSGVVLVGDQLYTYDIGLGEHGERKKLI